MRTLFRIVSSTVLSALLFFLIGSTAHAAPPENFQVTQIIGSGLDGPSGFELAPDGRIFVLERTGKIKVIKDGVLLPEPFADLPSIASGDRGLIGIAFDPEFNITNHYVYFYYTGLDKLNRLVRYDASGDVGTNGPFLLYQTNSPSEELHVGGSIRFGPDGKMYFAVGDNGYPPNAQNLGNPHGKILRINKDGSIPFDNPFVGQPGALPEIWAYGMRNPWRFQFDSATGELYGGDVGDFTWEEINHIVKGGNYGWPVAEGLCSGFCPYINPIYTYNHDGESAAVTGGPIYRGNMFPDEYKGSLFFGDYAKGFIKRIELDELGNSLGVFDFDTTAGAVVDLKVGPDGSLYYITYWPGRLYKITYNPDNHIPVANATADVTKGLDPLTVNFSSSGSYDPDDDPITYLWDFGDGTTSIEENPTKIYPNKGTYTVDLTVTDNQNNVSHAVPISIQVGTPPTVTIGAPTEGMTYKAGDMIHYTAHAVDAAGFDLNDAAIKTEILLHHDTHIHPFLGPLTGRTGTFTTPTHGEASANTWFEIKMTATDTNGLSDTKSVNIYPITSSYTLETEPVGLKVYLDGVPKDTPATISGVVNFRRELNAPTTQELNGVQYQFEKWADNQPQRHFFATQEEPVTYTAIYRESPAFVGEYFDNPTLSGTPVLTRLDPSINFDWENVAPDPLLPDDFFSVRWTKMQYFAQGKYKFISATDDGLRLYIDGQLLIDEFHGGAQAYTVEITLAAGEHEIVVEYLEEAGGAAAKLQWDLSPIQPVAGVFQAEYFNNKELSGVPVLLRDDAEINFVWDGGSPDPLITPDDFSARWSKTEELPGGIYEFHVAADDGVRLYVDGELILDKWIDQATTEYAVEKALTAGSHTIVLEYYEHGGGAVAILDYHKHAELPNPDSYTGEYFNNKTLSGEPVLTRQDSTINFDWNAGSPDPVVNNDNFSVRWTKTATLEEGTYEFTVAGDDGVRLYVDGEVILDKWIDQGPTTYKVNKILAAGAHTIVLEYYEAGGGAVAKLSYLKKNTNPPPSSGEYVGEYFNNQDLFPPFAFTRNDSEINFDWAGGSPDPLLNANNFSVRWTKTATLVAGTYEFTTTSDDGIRLYVDDELLIDKWIDQGPTTYTVQKALTAGNHTIVVEYFENGGGATAKMNYELIEAASEEFDLTYTAKYWNVTGLTSSPLMPVTEPTLTRQEDAIDHTWNGASPDPVITPDDFIAQWTKRHKFEEDGTYKFTTTSDDGVRVYIDDELLIDQWNDHAATTHTAEKTLTAGVHTLRVEYYENGGGAVMKFNYEKLTPATPVPTEQPAIVHALYDDALQNGWVNWSWSSTVDFAATLFPFKDTMHITWQPTGQWAGLFFHNHTAVNTASYKEITFAVRATKENQKLEAVLLDDVGPIAAPVKLENYGGNPVVGSYKIYVIPLSDLGAANRDVTGFQLKDTSGDMINEIYVDSVGFTAL